MAERSIVVTGTVPAPQAAVWELICDTSRYAEWVDATDEVVRTDGPAEQGSTYDERNTVLGPVKASSHWTVTEHEPPRRTVHRGEGITLVAQATFETALQPVGDDATEVTLTFRYVPALGPAGRLLAAAVLHRQAEAGFRHSMDNLTTLVAREHGAPA